MTSIYLIVLPMFALIALGGVAGRRAVGGAAMVQGLSRFLGDYALPALLFSAMARAKIPDAIEWGFVAAFFIAAFIVFGVGSGWMWSLRKRDDLASVGFAASFSSIGLIGAPIILDAYGPSVAVPVMLLIVFQSPLLFTLATVVAETRRAENGRPRDAVVAAIRGTLFSPLILSIIVGLVVNQTRLPVPDVLMNAVDLISKTVLPCACFSLGAALSARLDGARRGSSLGRIGQAATMALLKTVAHPLLTWVLATKVFMLSPYWLAPAVTAAALPIGINAYAFADRYNSERELVSLSLLFSTIVSPISISIAFMAAMG